MVVLSLDVTWLEDFKDVTWWWILRGIQDWNKIPVEKELKSASGGAGLARAIVIARQYSGSEQPECRSRRCDGY
jgi:hypothetical protein